MTIVFVAIACCVMAISSSLKAQCPAPNGNSQSGCAGASGSFGANSPNGSVTNHIWYADSTGSTLASVQPTVNMQAPGTNIWISSYSGTMSQPATVYVAAVCSGTESSRTKVTYTITSGSTLAIQLSPVNEPWYFCEGDSVTLTATGGSGYQWRKDSPSGSVLGTGTTFNPTTSGTYYLTGNNNCSQSQTTSLPLTFNANIGTVTVSTESENFCQGSQTISQFSVSASGSADAYMWEVTGDGNSVDSDGTVTWNPFYSGTAWIKSTAYGCHGTTVTDSASITVFPTPIIYTTPSDSTTIPFGEESTTLVATNGSGYSYQWYFNGTVVAGADSASILVFESGVYRTAGIDSNGCAGNSGEIEVSIENNYNYIITNVIETDSVMDENQVSTLALPDKTQSIAYFDGLGRPMQSVATQGSPGQKDVVQPMVYDAYGRETVKFLPYTSTSTNGWYATNAVGTPDLNNIPANYSNSAQYQFYQNNPTTVAQDTMPYAVTRFEPSPLNRVLKQGAPGAAWQPNDTLYSLADHAVKKRYPFNDSAEVHLFKYDPATEALTNTGYYEASQLMANKTIDEHNNEVIEYVDKQGRTVLKKVQYKEETGTKHYAETYYIYDDFGQLVLVLPPEFVAKMGTMFNEN